MKVELNRNIRKRTFGFVRPTKIQISLRIRAVWSESSLGAIWIANDAMFLHADNKGSDQTALMRRLIWVRWTHMPKGTFPDVAAQILLCVYSCIHISIKTFHSDRWENISTYSYGFSFTSIAVWVFYEFSCTTPLIKNRNIIIGLSSFLLESIWIPSIAFEPWTYVQGLRISSKLVSAPSEDSDWPGRQRSLIWVFAGRCVGRQGSKKASCGGQRWPLTPSIITTGNSLQENRKRKPSTGECSLEIAKYTITQ